MCSQRLNKDQIMEIIPHREPMLLIDEATEIEEGKKIIAKFYIDPDREIFKGHFPGDPVFPGVYTVETMAQASDILLLSLDRYRNTIPFFIGIDQVKFINKIKPGDTIEIHSNILSENTEKAIVTCYAEVYNQNELSCTGNVTLAMR